MSRLVALAIPAEFISQRVALSHPEVDVGVALGWLRPEDAETLAIGISGSESADVGTAGGSGRADPRHVWAGLALAWLWEVRATYSDPLTTIELIWADLGYPPQLNRLIRWMPPEDGTPVGESGLLARWRKYVEATADGGGR